MAALDHIQQALDSLKGERATTVAERTRLDSELVRIDRAIASLDRTMRDLSGDLPGSGQQVELLASPEIATGPFADMELTEAAYAVLKSHGDQSNSDLARLLLAGGMQTKSDARRFGETVRSILIRPKAARFGIRKNPTSGKWTITSE